MSSSNVPSTPLNALKETFQERSDRLNDDQWMQAFCVLGAVGEEQQLTHKEEASARKEEFRFKRTESTRQIFEAAKDLKPFQSDAIVAATDKDDIDDEQTMNNHDAIASPTASSPLAKKTGWQSVSTKKRPATSSSLGVAPKTAQPMKKKTIQQFAKESHFAHQPNACGGNSENEDEDEDLAVIPTSLFGPNSTLKPLSNEEKEEDRKPAARYNGKYEEVEEEAEEQPRVRLADVVHTNRESTTMAESSSTSPQKNSTSSGKMATTPRQKSMIPSASYRTNSPSTGKTTTSHGKTHSSSSGRKKAPGVRTKATTRRPTLMGGKEKIDVDGDVEDENRPPADIKPSTGHTIKNSDGEEIEMELKKKELVSLPFAGKKPTFFLKVPAPKGTHQHVERQKSGRGRSKSGATAQSSSSSALVPSPPLAKMVKTSNTSVNSPVAETPAAEKQQKQQQQPPPSKSVQKGKVLQAAAMLENQTHGVATSSTSATKKSGTISSSTNKSVAKNCAKFNQNNTVPLPWIPPRQKSAETERHQRADKELDRDSDPDVLGTHYPKRYISSRRSYGEHGSYEMTETSMSDTIHASSSVKRKIAETDSTKTTPTPPSSLRSAKKTKTKASAKKQQTPAPAPTPRRSARNAAKKQDG